MLVVGLLGGFQRAGEVGRQGIVQPGLCLFGGLCGGCGLVGRSKGLHPGAGQRLQQRMGRKELPGRVGALLCRLPGLFLFGFAGSDLFFAHADVAAHLLHSGAGGFPCGFPRFFLAVHLLQQGFSRYSASLPSCSATAFRAFSAAVRASHRSASCCGAVPRWKFWYWS